MSNQHPQDPVETTVGVANQSKTAEAIADQPKVITIEEKLKYWEEQTPILKAEADYLEQQARIEVYKANKSSAVLQQINNHFAVNPPKGQGQNQKQKVSK